MSATVESATARVAEGYLNYTCATLNVAEVYGIARLIGADVEKLIDVHGKGSIEGLMPKIVKVLELLESFASRSQAHKMKEEELLRALEAHQVQEKKGRDSRETEERTARRKILELQQELQEKEYQCERIQEDLQAQLQQLKKENRELHTQLKGHNSLRDDMQLQEMEETQKLKDMVDKQRAELRAKSQQITSAAMEAEALQEQLTRFMQINAELHHRHKALQTQLRSIGDRKADMEADICQKDYEIQGLQAQLAQASVSQTSTRRSPLQQTEKPAKQKDQDVPCFTKQEVRDMLYERNELKANLFLLQEELNYYQRQILNDERFPGFLLEALRTSIRKQRKHIKAKMLGIPAHECSSDEEEKGPLFETKVDSPEEKPAESRIKSFFNFLTRTGSRNSPTRISSSTWEIIGDLEAEGEGSCDTKDLHST